MSKNQVATGGKVETKEQESAKLDRIIVVTNAIKETIEAINLLNGGGGPIRRIGGYISGSEREKALFELEAILIANLFAICKVQGEYISELTHGAEV